MMIDDIDWLAYEHRLWDNGIQHIAGVDEAGRGPLAGPVVAAAVVLRKDVDLPLVIDSKQMSEKERDEALIDILNNCLAFAVAATSVKLIDRVNILQATMTAMTRAVNRLRCRVDHVLVDGNRLPAGFSVEGEAIINGDACSRSIAAASVIAKVTRDRLMRNLDRLYPRYGFARNKGYATTEHIDAIHKFGPSPHHRFSFNPVRQCYLDFNND